MIRVPKALMAYVFVGVVMGWSGWAVLDDPTAIPILVFVALAASFVFCGIRCHAAGWGYFEGLEHLSRRHVKFSFKLSALILLPIYFLVHMGCVLVCLVGIFQGPEFIHKWWGKLTERDRPLRGELQTYETPTQTVAAPNQW